MGCLSGACFLGEDCVIQWSMLACKILLGDEVVDDDTRHVVGIQEVSGLLVTPETE